MPSDKKRINLTVPDAVYEKLQAYKELNGITNDASACLQLIVQQLKAQETSALMLKMLKGVPIERLTELAMENEPVIREALEKAALAPGGK